MVSVRVFLGSLAGAPPELAEAVVREVGLDAATLRDPEAYLPCRDWARLLQRLEHTLGDPLVGIRAARALQWGHYGVIDYVVGTSPNLEQAFAAFARYFKILSTSIEMLLEREEGHLWVVRKMAGDEAMVMPRHAAEFGLATTVRRFGLVTSRPWQPIRVTFRYPAPIDDAPYREAFGVVPEFGAARDGFCVAAGDLDMAMKSPDPALHQIIASHGQRLLGHLPEDDSFVAQVARAIRDDLMRGAPSVDEVAKALAMSRRSLQRRLSEEHTSYRELADRVRHELAERYLRSPRMSIAEVAYMVGFSDPSAFNRAFRQWTGKTPGEFRTSA